MTLDTCKPDRHGAISSPATDRSSFSNSNSSRSSHSSTTQLNEKPSPRASIALPALDNKPSESNNTTSSEIYFYPNVRTPTYQLRPSQTRSRSAAQLEASPAPRRPSLSGMKAIGRSTSVGKLTSQFARRLSTKYSNIFSTPALNTSMPSAGTTPTVSPILESALNLPESIRPDKSEIDFLHRTESGSKKKKIEEGMATCSEEEDGEEETALDDSVSPLSESERMQLHLPDSITADKSEIDFLRRTQSGPRKKKLDEQRGSGKSEMEFPRRTQSGSAEENNGWRSSVCGESCSEEETVLGGESSSWTGKENW